MLADKKKQATITSIATPGGEERGRASKLKGTEEINEKGGRHGKHA